MEIATISTSTCILYSSNSNFSKEMLIKDNHRLPKINRFDKCISYIGLNLVLGLTRGLAFKRYT